MSNTINVKVDSLDAKSLLTNPNIVVLDTKDKLVLNNIQITLDTNKIIDEIRANFINEVSILGLNVPPTTRVYIYNADGTCRGALFTTASTPKLNLSGDDSGVIYLTDGKPDSAEDRGYYYNNGIGVGINGSLPLGLSVSNDKNLTSKGDITWITNSFSSLQAGKDYSFYVYGLGDGIASGFEFYEEWVDLSHYIGQLWLPDSNIYVQSSSTLYIIDSQYIGFTSDQGRVYYICDPEGIRVTTGDVIKAVIYTLEPAEPEPDLHEHVWLLDADNGDFKTYYCGSCSNTKTVWAQECMCCGGTGEDANGTCPSCGGTGVTWPSPYEYD